MASNNYGAIGLIGGSTGFLDAIDGTNLATGDAAYVKTSTGFYVYHLDASSGATESSPDIISPDANAGNKRWLLLAFAKLRIPDTDGSNELQIKWNENDSADRVLNVKVNSADRTIDVTGNITFANNFITVGNYAITFTSTGTTALTLPVSGTLATTPHQATHILGGGAEIDGDKIDIDWTPAYYTPATNSTTADNLDHLTSHLKGIDTAVNVAGGISNIVEDTTPQLGGDLDINSKGIKFASPATITDCKDEDDMSSNSDTMLATQQSIKTYTDTKASATHATTHILGGGDEVDGDKLDIDWIPAYYTPATNSTTADNLDHLTAHLKGIDTKCNDARTTNMEDNILQRPKLLDYGETLNAIGSIATSTHTIDIESGNVVSATLATASTLTFSNPPASGTAGSFTLLLTNGGAYTVTWPTTIDWAGGTAPSLTAAGIDWLTFASTNATTWAGFVAGLDVKDPA